MDETAGLQYLLLECNYLESGSGIYGYEVPTSSLNALTSVYGFDCSGESTPYNNTCVVKDIDFKDQTCEYLYSQLYWHALDPTCVQVMTRGGVKGPFERMSGDYVVPYVIYTDQLLELEPNYFALGKFNIISPNYHVNGTLNQ